MGLFGSKKAKPPAGPSGPTMLGADIQAAQTESLRELARRLDAGYDAALALIEREGERFLGQVTFEGEYAFELPSGEEVYIQTVLIEALGDGIIVDVSAGRAGSNGDVAFFRAELYGAVGGAQQQPLTAKAP